MKLMSISTCTLICGILTAIIIFVLWSCTIRVQPPPPKEGFSGNLSSANINDRGNIFNYFANTEFKPECCPGVYSNSTGCPCLSKCQQTYFYSRAGNNVPFSEY